MTKPPSNPPPSRQSPVINMINGGIAGGIAKTFTSPLERIKMMSQTQGGGGGGGSSGNATKGNGKVAIEGPVTVARRILRTEGLIGFWAGNGANLMRIFPSKGVVFSTNDYYKSLLSSTSRDFNVQANAGVVSFVSGGLAGTTACAITYPLDLVRGRISGSSATSTGSKRYKGVFNVVRITVREEGFRALYRGVKPTLLGAVPYEGIKFGTVGVLDTIFPPSNDDNVVFRKVAFGAAGGVMAGCITYPNDTIRRMLQLQGTSGATEKYEGYVDCFRKTFKNHGVTRFYRGMGVNLVRMAPNTAMQFGVYEYLKGLQLG